MSERRKMIVHNNRMIIFIDYSNLQGAEYLRVVEESIRDSSKSDTERLVLVNAAGSVMNKNVLKALKKLSAKTSDNISKIAIVGLDLTGVQKFFMVTVTSLSRADVRPFDTQEEALEWLTSKPG